MRGTVADRVRGLRDVPEEIWFFVRLAIYGWIVGIAYWFLTYEVVGSLLLIAFGFASTFIALLLDRTRRRAGRPPEGPPTPDQPDLEGPFGSPIGRLPAPTFAPLEVGIGIGIASLSLAFGAWLALAAVLPLLGGTLSWLRSAEREAAATRRDEAAAH
jgi:hypothetical protein